jgi:putative transposase
VLLPPVEPSQYASISYTDRLEEIGAKPSIGTVGDSFDNALAECRFALFKTELFRNPAVLSEVGGHWKGLDDLELAISTWIHWFNEERIHTELGDLSPSEFEANYADKNQVNAA